MGKTSINSSPNILDSINPGKIAIKQFFKFLFTYLLISSILCYLIFKIIYLLPVISGSITIALISSLVNTITYITKKTKFVLEESIKERDEAIEERNLWQQSLKERCIGFPTLNEMIVEYEKRKDDLASSFLYYKKHPAKKGAVIVKEETKKRRDAERELRQIKSIIEYYEQIAPFLLDFKEEIIDEKDHAIKFDNYTDEELEDRITDYLTKEEYRKLSSLEKSELALERFWKRKKSKRAIGKLYEQYIGYCFEQKGYEVNYYGIIKGYEDLGRDLICTKKK